MPEVKVLGEFKCWNCGGKDTIVGKAVEDLIERGRIQRGTEYASKVVPVPLLQPQTAGLTVPMMVEQWDICAKCGVEYIKKVVTIDAPVTMQQPGPMPGKLPGPGFFNSPPFLKG